MIHDGYDGVSGPLLTEARGGATSRHGMTTKSSQRNNKWGTMQSNPTVGLINLDTDLPTWTIRGRGKTHKGRGGEHGRTHGRRDLQQDDDPGEVGHLAARLVTPFLVDGVTSMKSLKKLSLIRKFYNIPDDP